MDRWIPRPGTLAFSSPARRFSISEHDIISGVNDFLRGARRLHILHHASEDEIHGAWMSQELRRHGYDISPGTLYPTLHAMEADGLLRSRRVVVGGSVLRVYRATPKGRRTLERMRLALRELAAEVLP